ncbi:MAG: molybdopterin-dependent oxidoreductase [Chloroflexi bacterium]|nr:molybdopterin-dependent oxidoreductase [Chloroflexota bacterium]
MSANGKQVTLTIDGKQVTVPAGLTVVDAARLAGIDIPVFCYHPKMEPVGMCRMCLVHIGRPVRDRATGEILRNEDGTPQIRWGRTLETGCTARVDDGLVVKTQTDEVAEARKAVLEFFLTSHPLDCPICDKGGECPLQNLTVAYGPTVSRFPYEFKLHLPKRVPLGDLIILDRERCILCGRCVRFQDEVVGDPVLSMDGRGRASYIITTSEPAFDSYWSGNTTDICPVGALTTVDFRFEARPWEMTHAASLCNLCPVGCNLTFDVRREPKLDGRLAVQRVLPRQNEWVNELWLCDKGRFAAYHFAQRYDERLMRPYLRGDQGLEPASSWAEALRVAAEAIQGAEGPLVTLVSGRLSNEDLYNLARLTDHLGGQKVLYTFMGGGEVVAQVGLGTGSNLAHLGQGDAIVVFASDLEEEAPMWRLRAKLAAERGAQLIVVNPRETKLDRWATHTVRYAYGEEVAAARAVAQDLAETLRQAEHVVIFYGQEGMDLPTSEAVARILGNLLLETGHAGRPDSGLIPVWPRNNDQGAWELGFRPVEDLAAVLREAGVVYIVAADPAGDDPYLAAALDEANFVIVQDLFLTETAQRADLVLPALAYIERGGTYTSGERRVQRFYPAVPAPEGLQPDFAIAAALARFFDLDLEPRSVATLVQQMAETVPTFRGWDPATLKQVKTQYPPVSRDYLHYTGAAHPNHQGVGEILPNAAQRGEAVEPFPVPAVEEEAREGLWAVPVTRLYDRGALVGRSATLEPRLWPAGQVLMHPQTAADLGLDPEHPAALEVREVTAWVTVALDETVPPGVVLVPRSVGVPLNAPAPATLRAVEPA